MQLLQLLLQLHLLSGRLGPNIVGQSSETHFRPHMNLKFMPFAVNHGLARVHHVYA